MTIDTLIIGYVQFTFGTTSSVTAAMRCDAPVQVNTNNLAAFQSNTFYDASTGEFYWGAGAIDPTYDRLYLYAYYQNNVGTQVGNSNTSSTYPFTWTTSDFFQMNFWYEKA